MDLPSYFVDFLGNIRLTPTQADACADGHQSLRDRLNKDDRLAPIIVNTFLQGSYKRSTIVKPGPTQASDVDVVVVTRLAQADYPNPEDAMDEFLPFLEEHYQGQYEEQGRSFGLTVPGVKLDLVITSAPSEEEAGILALEALAASEDLTAFKEARAQWPTVEAVLQKMMAKASEPGWKLEPLYIPDREARCWEPTHPLQQILWTVDKNARCNGHYVNVVKAIKWWRRIDPLALKYPKGYPLEHLIGRACPDGITSVAQGIVETLEALETTYASRQKPVLPDHGVPTNDVLKRLTQQDFEAFYDRVTWAASVAREAFDSELVTESANRWRDLFGDEFPAPPEKGGDGDTGRGPSGGFTPREGPSRVPTGRFA
ncbi:MAG: hypothetical protein AMXMBFR23_07280 [Chloroflexota bacterium]